ncbi:hypothetical protein HELRODRAFT_78689 [Helobdella robusta]|uniref:G-patch domain-containing protein n=1 Tax=Helobdella robusta TaxID=6412 RepID=T1G3E7_HELRO|nr:hypothetical protein HELRODRAFT_78689 [Helobdella robusta]ESO04611.1 hypothetical protein HELRODRAFT_78689 [Helobdella robusta]
MLAERKVKQKLSINPQGLSWAKDESKFGQKLMEKMGWSKGKGLGAKESGNVDFVKVSLKIDKKGVGCSHQSANNWIAHQDDFTSILANLGNNNNNNNNAAAADDDDDDTNNNNSNNKQSLVDLEEKSKRSSSRLHYQKFVRSKNLATKEQKDLDCIFGRRDSNGYIIKSASTNELGKLGIEVLKF